MVSHLRSSILMASGEFGGAEISTATLLRHRPGNVEAGALLLSPGPLVEVLGAAGIEARAGTLVGRPDARRAAAVVRGLARELRAARPDVALAVGVKAALLAAPAARAARVPLVWRKVDFAYDGPVTHALSLACRGVITSSRALAEAVAHRRRLGVLPPPVRLDSDFAVSECRPPATIGSIGRLVGYKGHAHVIEAAARLRPAHPDVAVVIAGAWAREHPGHAEELSALAERLGMADRVTVLGYVDRVEEVLDRLTVLAQATHRDHLGFGREGLGAALIEASWAGLPVVATTGGGAGEAVVDGVTGTLVPPGDPAALAGALGSYLSSPSKAREIGRRGRERALERYRPDRLARLLFELLAASAR